jgi:hypothetical protein
MVSLPCEAAPDVAIVGDRNRIHTPDYERLLILERSRRSKIFLAPYRKLMRNLVAGAFLFWRWHGGG